MRVAGEAIARQSGIENDDLAAGTAELQGGGEAGKASADDDDVIHGDGLRVVDGGGGLGLARNIVQRYALETGSERASASARKSPSRPQAGRRLSFRICLSKAQAGTKRRRALTRPAVEPAVYRSLGFGSVAAATIDFATMTGSSPPCIALAITRSNACRCSA